jgi:hypothetical protein
MRRTFPWVLRSQYYTKFEAFVLIWSQLYANANLPLQYMPMQAFMMVPLAITKSFIWKHVFSRGGISWEAMCSHEDCVSHFKIGNNQFAVPFTFMLFLAIFIFITLLWIFDCCIRCTVTRYRPRPLWCFNAVFIAPFTLVPFLTYCQYFALRDYCFGGAKFIPTKRSPTGSFNSLDNVSNNSLPKIASDEKVAEPAAQPTGGGMGKKTNKGNGMLGTPLLEDEQVRQISA